jgi:hypothetical protein
MILLVYSLKMELVSTTGTILCNIDHEISINLEFKKNWNLRWIIFSLYYKIFVLFERSIS